MPKQLKYAYDDLLEMLGGYEYYTSVMIDFIYHELNNLDADKTVELLNECLEQQILLTEKFNHMTDEIEQSESVIESKESI
jgi:hypothetical protein